MKSPKTKKVVRAKRIKVLVSGKEFLDRARTIGFEPTPFSYLPQRIPMTGFLPTKKSAGKRKSKKV